MLLELPVDELRGDAKQQQAACERSCLRSRCNPYMGGPHCQERCKSCCEVQTQLTNHSRRLLAKAKHRPIGYAVLHHAFDWGSKEGGEEEGGGEEDEEEVVRHARRSLDESTAAAAAEDPLASLSHLFVPSRKVHASHHEEWLGPTVRRHLLESGGMGVSIGARMQETGVAGADSARGVNRNSMLLRLRSQKMRRRVLLSFQEFVEKGKEIEGLVDEAGENAQAIRDLWARLEELSNQVTLTFLDLTLSHPILDEHMFQGKKNLMGSLGGAGVFADLVVKNSVTLQVGMLVVGRNAAP